MHFLFFVFIALTSLAMPLQAQEQHPDTIPNVSQDDLSALIKTLESETARQDFITNLKTLTESQIQDEKPALDLGVGKTTTGLVSAYERFIIDTGLSEDLVGRIVLTTMTVFLGFVVSWIVRKCSLFLRDHMHKIRDRYGLVHDRFRLYARIVRYIGYAIVAALTLYSIGLIWDLADSSVLLGEASRSFLINFTNIAVIVMVAIGIWEVINTAIESYLRALDGPNYARMRTIIPIARNILFIVFALLFSLVLLSEIGINVLPLLAGAGVVGIAVGFGAQTMVKDFLTGFTIILEDLIQVGDVAKLGDKIGVVEKITMRKVQLRDLAGIVYTVPFSEISIVENWTKDFSYYVFDVGIAYRENIDEVMNHLRSVDAEMREDEAFRNLILEPLEILGVDRFADSAVIIKARIKTLPVKQWIVGREFNRRMKITFDKYNIEIPFPHQTVYFGTDKSGHAPAAPVTILPTEKRYDDT